MAKLGRRERQAKRERILKAKQEHFAKKEAERQLLTRLEAIPQRELRQLSASLGHVSLTDKLMAHAHTPGIFVQNAAGGGGRALKDKLRQQSRKGQGPVFAPGFMAVPGKQHKDDEWIDLDLSTAENPDKQALSLAGKKAGKSKPPALKHYKKL